MIDLEKLAQLAAEATPGPWPPSGFECRVTHDRGLLCGDGQLVDHSFFAACDPDTVAALTRAVRAADTYASWNDEPRIIPRTAETPNRMIAYWQLREALAPFRDAAP